MMAGDSDVNVGLAGDLISRDANASATVAKAGGRPNFTGKQAPCVARDLSCSRCNGLLCLVTQVPSPPQDLGIQVLPTCPLLPLQGLGQDTKTEASGGTIERTWHLAGAAGPCYPWHGKHHPDTLHTLLHEGELRIPD